MPRLRHNPDKMFIDFLESTYTDVYSWSKNTYGTKKADSGHLKKLTAGFTEKKFKIWEVKKQNIIDNSIENAGDNNEIKEMIERSFKAEKKALDLLIQKIEKGEVGSVTYITESDGKTIKTKKLGYRPLYVREIREAIDILRIQQNKATNVTKGDFEHNIKNPPKISDFIEQLKNQKE